MPSTCRYRSVPRRLTGDFRCAVAEIFKSNAVFAFICGSVAGGEAVKKSDIDVFIATRKASAKQAIKFRQWYFETHRKHGFVPDVCYPGEVVPVRELARALKLVKQSVPARQLTRKVLYDGLVWAGMLSGPGPRAFVGDRVRYRLARAEAEQICRNWVASLKPAALRSRRLDSVLKGEVFYGGYEKRDTKKIQGPSGSNCR